MPLFDRKTRGLRILGISLALLNVALWLSVPAIGGFIDRETGRRTNPTNPMLMRGVQELFVYFDPWLASFVFPVIYTLGLATIPFLRKSSDTQTPLPLSRLCNIFVALILIAIESVWLSLIGFELFFRGPNWNIFWPGEAWDSNRIVPLNQATLSQYYWLKLVGHWPDVNTTNWWSREYPGLLLLGIYLAAGLFIAHYLFRAERRITPYWRWASLVLLTELAALVPIKIILYWLFNIKYLICVPEHSFNF
jgi:hypothetical protein